MGAHSPTIVSLQEDAESIGHDCVRGYFPCILEYLLQDAVIMAIYRH